MTDRPIIFSASMVRALLDGRKTQTRRVFVPPAPFAPDDDITIQLATGSIASRWKAGDRLWVREAAAVRYTGWHHIEGHKHSVSHAADENEHGQWIGSNACGCGIRDGEAPTHFPRRSHTIDGRLRWSPSIHMPRWASRLTLVVTEVRVERLNDISEADAIAEGVEPSKEFADRFLTPAGDYAVPVVAFHRLWNSIHGPDAWDTNPWVAAISFTVHRANIDALDIGAAA